MVFAGLAISFPSGAVRWSSTMPTFGWTSRTQILAPWSLRFRRRGGWVTTTRWFPFVSPFFLARKNKKLGEILSLLRWQKHFFKVKIRRDFQWNYAEDNAAETVWKGEQQTQQVVRDSLMMVDRARVDLAWFNSVLAIFFWVTELEQDNQIIFEENAVLKTHAFGWCKGYRHWFVSPFPFCTKKSMRWEKGDSTAKNSEEKHVMASGEGPNSITDLKPISRKDQTMQGYVCQSWTICSLNPVDSSEIGKLPSWEFWGLSKIIVPKKRKRNAVFFPKLCTAIRPLIFAIYPNPCSFEVPLFRITPMSATKGRFFSAYNENCKAVQFLHQCMTLGLVTNAETTSWSSQWLGSWGGDP